MGASVLMEYLVSKSESTTALTGDLLNERLNGPFGIISLLIVDPPFLTSFRLQCSN